MVLIRFLKIEFLKLTSWSEVSSLVSLLECSRQTGLIHIRARTVSEGMDLKIFLK